MRELVKQVLPPFLLKARKWITLSSPVYRTYDEALTACRQATYESDDVVKVVVEKTIRFKKDIQLSPICEIGTLRTLIGLGLAKSADRLNVLDFGGGGGYHHALARVALGNSNTLRWNVVETAAMVKEAQRIATDNLKFFDNVSDATTDLGYVDLIFTSSALQYCRNPLVVLRQLTEVGAKYMFITRTPFNDSDETFISVQTSRLSSNGPGPLPKGFSDRNISYPITFSSKLDVERIISERYDVRFVFIEDKGAFRAGRNDIGMYGYFCALR
ncbi:MAG: methyltransferase, TIGR04325 family [Acidiferrobacteraceae bacterium]